MAHTHAGHDHSHAQPASNFAFAVSVALNFTFVVVEVAYGLTANSLALIADAGHNLSDVMSLLIAWAAVYLSRAAPTKHRTYGFRGSSILAALANAIILLIAVGGIVWEAAQRIAEPHAVAGGTVMWVALIGIGINAVSAMLFVSGRKHDLNVRSAFVHLVADAAVSAGVVLAGLAIVATGWQWLDPAVSMAVALVIVVTTWGLLRESLNLAIDAVPQGIDPHAVEAYLANLPGVRAVHDLHIWAMSTTETALTAHLVIAEPPANDLFLRNAAHGLHDRFRIGHTTIQVERGDDTVPCPQEPAHIV